MGWGRVSASMSWDHQGFGSSTPLSPNRSHCTTVLGGSWYLLTSLSTVLTTVLLTILGHLRGS